MQFYQSSPVGLQLKHLPEFFSQRSKKTAEQLRIGIAKRGRDIGTETYLERGFPQLEKRDTKMGDEILGPHNAVGRIGKRVTMKKIRPRIIYKHPAHLVGRKGPSGQIVST